ncbi:MAG: DUF3303 family protein [Acidimicrobiales bacterium]|jgi:hypothetical protein
MLFQTNYTLIGDRSVETGKELMALFMQRGSSPGEIAHYIHVDGSGGTVVSENNDIAELHDTAMAYAPYMMFEILPVRKVEEAVTDILKHYG